MKPRVGGIKAPEVLGEHAHTAYEAMAGAGGAEIESIPAEPRLKRTLAIRANQTQISGATLAGLSAREAEVLRLIGEG